MERSEPIHSRAGAIVLLAGIVAMYAATWFLFPPPSVLCCFLTALLSATFAALGVFAPRRGFHALLVFLPLSDNINVLTVTGYFSPAVLAFAPLFAGWLVHTVWRREPAPAADSLPRLAAAFWMIAAAGSAIITAARYSNGWLPWLDPAGITTMNLLGETNDQMIRAIFSATCVLVVGPLLAWMAFALLPGEDRRRTAAWMLMAGLAVSAVYGRWQAQLNVAFGNPVHFAVRNQANSTFIDPNALGAWCFMALPLAAGLFLLDRSAARRMLLAIIAIGTLLMLAASGSRTGVLGLMIAAMFAGAGLAVRWWRSADSARHRKLRVAALVGCMAAAGVVGAFFVAGPGADTSIGRRLHATRESMARDGLMGVVAADRWALWSRSAEVTRQYPVGGIGMGAYWMEIPNFMDANFTEGFYRDNAANWFLQVSAELGIAGFLIAGWLIGAVLWRSSEVMLKTARGTMELQLGFFAAAGVLAMIAVFLTGPHTNAAQVQLMFWFLIALVYAPDETAACRCGTGARRAMVIAGCLLVATVFAAQIQASLGPLEFNSRKAALKLEASGGYYPWEKNANDDYIRWARADSWMLLPDARRLAMGIYVAHPDATAENPVRVDVTLDGKLLRSDLYTAPGQRRDFVFDTPPADGHQLRLEIKVSRAFIPSRLIAGSVDNRELGVL